MAEFTKRAVAAIYALGYLAIPFAFLAALYTAVIAVVEWDRLGYRMGAVLAGLSLSFISSVLSAAAARVLPGRRRLVCLMALYCCIVIFFGSAYQLLYLHQPSSFSFSESVQEGAVTSATIRTQGRLRQVVEAEFLVTELLARPELVVSAAKVPGHLQEFDGVSVTYEVTEKYRYGVVIGALLHISNGETLAKVGGSVRGRGYHAAHVVALSDAEGSDEVSSSLKRLLGSLRDERIELSSAVKESLLGQPDLDLFDFVYFSAVTMTTLGYGDVIPNGRLSRLLVVVQTLAGVFFLGYALLIFSPLGASQGVFEE